MSRLGTGWLRSLEHRLRALAPVTVGLIGLLVVVEIVHGFRIVGTPWFGGDLLYHQALAHEILRGEFPPGGPYAGLPTYYPPGFHILLAMTMALTGGDAVRADQLLTVVWLPVLPLGTFLLARRVTGRAWVALMAATLTVFAGAYDLRPGRLWVNSLFLSGHEAYPLYPRDLVFGIIPFALMAFLRALEPRGRSGSVLLWAGLAGLLFGIAGLIQVQLLLPLPVALAVTAVVVFVRDPARRVPALAAVVATGIMAAAVVAPWLIGQLDAIGRNGGVAIGSSDALEAARFGFWSYPREFGLLLPFGIVGAGVALLLLRLDRSVPLPETARHWRPDPVEAPLLLVVWWALAFALGILYRPDWPLEDALRPQRLWLLASQPLAILAAIGLTATAEAFIGRRWRRPRLVIPAIVLAAIVTCAPATAATALLLRSTWTRPSYAHLDFETDRVPDLAALLGDRRRSPQTVLTYEDWSSLTWFLTGEHVVGLVPAGFAKLAYDPSVFTGRSQAERRTDVGRAFSGDPAALASVADAYDARIAIVALRNGRWGLVDVSAALAPTKGNARVVAGNGWDGVELPAGAQLHLPVEATGAVDLEIRLVSTPATPAGRDRTVTISATQPDGTLRELARIVAPATAGTWQVIRATVSLEGGTPPVLTASAPVTVQSIRGFVGLATPPAGWRVTAETPEAALLERVR